MFDLLKELCAIPGISGDEGQVADYIKKKIAPYVHHVEVDSMGNVLAFKQGASSEKTLMVAAHMDEVGLIVKKIDKEGFLKFETVGGIDSRILPGKRVYVGPKGICGVLGIKAIHLQTREERSQAVQSSRMYIDIGASSQEEALEHVELGDSVTFDPEYITFGDGYLCSKAIDDRAGCAIMLELIKEDLQYDTWFAFTVQEEVGTRGATIAAERIHPQEAIIIETTTCADFTGVEETDHVTKAKGGAVISVMDRGTVYDKEMVQRAISLAKEHGINYQMKQSIAGGNDAGAVHKSGAGVRTLAISVPCRYLHSTSCVAAVEDIQAVHDICAKLICE